MPAGLASTPSAESPSETERLVKEHLTRSSRFTVDFVPELSRDEMIEIRFDAIPPCVRIVVV